MGGLDGIELVEAAYRDNREVVYRLCLSILKDPAQAEDATQEAFLRLLRQPEVGNPQAWLVRVARNHCLDLIQQRRRAVAIDGSEPAVPDHAARVLDRLALRRGLSGLNPRERLALHLSLVEGLGLDGVANALGLSYAAAAQVVSRARRRLAMAVREAALTAGLLLRRLLQRGQGRDGRYPAAFAPVVGVGAGLLLVLSLGEVIPTASPEPPVAAVRLSPVLNESHETALARAVRPGPPSTVAPEPAPPRRMTRPSLAPPSPLPVPLGPARGTVAPPRPVIDGPGVTPLLTFLDPCPLAPALCR